MSYDGNRVREEAAKQREKRKRRERGENILVGFLGVVLILGLVAAAVAFGGAIFYVAWNLGVVNIAAAVGGSVSTISYWTAIGGSLAVGILSRIFRRAPAAQATVKG